MTTRAIAVRALKNSTNERQFHDTVDISNSVVGQSTVFTVVPFNIDIDQGTTAQERQGSTITLLSMDLRLFVVKDPALGEPVNFVRVIICFDKQPDGALMTDTDLLEDPVGTNILQQLGRFRSTTKSRRFSVLHDRVYTMSDGLIPWLKTYIHINLKRRQTKWSGNPATIVNLTYGALYMLIASNQPTAANPPSMSGLFRLRFLP